jgi:two-component system cell cycle response regulator DivK
MAKILIVEDNVDLLEILRELMSADHEVVTARRGEDAIQRAREHRPDLVILDLQLPLMDGIEAGRWIKQELAPKRVAILALTALAQAGDPEAVLRSGCCDAYMSKPASLPEIRSRVEELLRGGGRYGDGSARAPG